MLNLFCIETKVKNQEEQIKKFLFLTPVKNDWAKIFQSTEPHKAEIIKGLLEENGINCVLMNKKDSSYLSFGEVEVYVRQEDVVKTLHLLESQK